MRISHVFSGIPATDFASAVVWYEKLLGRPPDNYPKQDEAVWQLTESGLIYVVADPQRAGHGLLTLIVDDLDAEVAELQMRGITPGDIETLPGTARRITITDPDGNSVALAQLRDQH